mgnify:CR=1 FL=1
MTPKKATTIDEQIAKFKERGMIINDCDEARMFLTHTCYYRLGSYSFPFEKKYPVKLNRNHKYKEGTLFNDVVELYHFDFELRSLLQKYLSIIEVSFKTVVINIISVMHINLPAWFSDPSVVNDEFAENFNRDVYSKNGLCKNKVIIEHHKKYPTDSFAPAWKTIECMTFGSVYQLYLSLKDEYIQATISRTYGLETLVFSNYIKSIRDLRNICAHGSVVFDYSLSYRLRNGPALKYTHGERNTNIGKLSTLVKYFLLQISPNMKEEYVLGLHSILNHYSKNERIKHIIDDCNFI